MSETTRILGAVLAGGGSRRFGSPKALAVYQGRMLVDHAIDALRPFADDVILCGMTHPPLPSLPDRPSPNLGPLGGLAAAFHHAEVAGCALVLTTGCDLPHIPTDLIARLIAAAPAVAQGQPLLGCWPASLAAQLDDHLARDDDRSLRGWIAAAGAQTLPAPAIPNINTPADLQALAGEG